MQPPALSTMPQPPLESASQAPAGKRSMPLPSLEGQPLALLGAEPRFPERLYVGRPNIGDKQQILSSVEDILDRRWLTNAGKYVQTLERQLAEFLGVKHCFAVCNATIGLEIAIGALGLTGEVIVPSYTFVATAHALQWHGITPVFADVDPITHCLDPESVARLITPRTTGIMGVHLWGQPCPVEALQELADRHGLSLLFDAAHAFGCSLGDRMIGGFGKLEVFSFHATKFFNTFEGGAITTNDDALAARINLMRNFGFSGWDQVECAGTNGKMSEVCAAMGLAGLDSLGLFLATNHRNYSAYRQGLDGLPGVRVLTYDERERCNYQYVVLEIGPEAPLTRDHLLNVLWRENVVVRRYFYPGCHRMEPYRTLFPNAGSHLPCTETLSDQVLVMPTGTAVSPADIAVICSIIQEAFQNAGAVLELLGPNPGIPAFSH